MLLFSWPLIAGQLAAWLIFGAETEDAAGAAGPGVISKKAWHAITGRAREFDHSAGYGSTKVALALWSAQGLAGRAVLIGYRLFECREYLAMQQLVRLVGGESPSEAGLQYIMGLSIACSAHSSSKDAAQAPLDAAVGHLFRAAAGLCNNEAGPLRLVLQLLRRQQQGESDHQASRGLQYLDPNTVDISTDVQLPHANGTGVVVGKAGKAAAGADGEDAQLRQRAEQQQEAMLRLQFDQAVMVLFEQKGVKEGALAFARAALSVVEEAYGPQQQQEKVKQQGKEYVLVSRGVQQLVSTHC
jgi:hypothetical protein